MKQVLQNLKTGKAELGAKDERRRGKGEEGICGPSY
jgi:hypothetical protein